MVHVVTTRFCYTQGKIRSVYSWKIEETLWIKKTKQKKLSPVMNCWYEYNFHDSCSRKAGDVLVKNLHLIPIARQMTVIFAKAGSQTEDRHIITPASSKSGQHFSEILHVTHAQTETAPSQRDTVGCIFYSRFTGNLSLRSVLCANLKKKKREVILWCTKSTRVINVCMMIEY